MYIFRLNFIGLLFLIFLWIVSEVRKEDERKELRVALVSWLCANILIYAQVYQFLG